MALGFDHSKHLTVDLRGSVNYFSSYLIKYLMYFLSFRMRSMADEFFVCYQSVTSQVVCPMQMPELYNN